MLSVRVQVKENLIKSSFAKNSKVDWIARRTLAFARNT